MYKVTVTCVFFIDTDHEEIARQDSYWTLDNIYHEYKEELGASMNIVYERVYEPLPDYLVDDFIEDQAPYEIEGGGIE